MSIAAKAKEAEAKDFPILQSGKKENSPLRLGIVAGTSCVKSMTSLQTLIKNVQELTKEEGEESEAKLREAIEILEGATSAIVGSWRDFWRTIFQEYRY